MQAGGPVSLDRLSANAHRVHDLPREESESESEEEGGNATQTNGGPQDQGSGSDRKSDCFIINSDPDIFSEPIIFLG